MQYGPVSKRDETEGVDKGETVLSVGETVLFEGGTVLFLSRMDMS